MQLDSATTANIGTVASLNPSAAMVTLLLLLLGAGPMCTLMRMAG